MGNLSNLEVGESDLGGRGIYTTTPIHKGDLIEVCPVIRMPEKDRQLIHRTKLHDYYFIWGKEDKYCAIVLGYGSLYNHSYSPNAEYFPDYKRDVLRFYALNDIKSGQEITVNYNGTPSVQDDLWFKSAEDNQT